MIAVAKRSVIRTLVSVPSALVALAFLLKWLGGPLARAAPSERDIGDDSREKAIAIRATLSVSDSRPGEGIARTVYLDIPGVLTPTFGISDSLPLTLSSDLAFGEPGQTITPGGSPWSPAIAYYVSLIQGLAVTCVIARAASAPSLPELSAPAARRAAPAG
jgi:hypothetical protein